MEDKSFYFPSGDCYTYPYHNFNSFASEGNFIWFCGTRYNSPGNAVKELALLDTTNFNYDSSWSFFDSTNSNFPSGATLNNIIVDNNSDKWIGTFGSGLLKFKDGYFTVFNTGNSCIPNDSIIPHAIDLNNDLWCRVNGAIVRISGLVNSTNTAIEKNEEFQIFPNPSNSNFTIIFPESGSSIIIYDVLGHEVFRKEKIFSLTEAIDLSGRENGIYFFKILSGNKIIVKKVILE